MDMPFEPNLSEDEQIYLEQPNMLQVEDIEGFSLPVFVEIKPLLSMEETTEDYVDAPIWTEPNEFQRDASVLDPGGVDHLVDRGHGEKQMPMETQDGPSFTSDFTTINPLSLDTFGGKSRTNPDKIERTEPERLFQQDEATSANVESFDLAASPHDKSDIPLEKFLSELEQSEPILEPDTDLFSIKGDPVHTDARQDGTTDAVSPREPAIVIPQPELGADHDTENPLFHVENGGSLENKVPPQVEAGITQERNPEDPNERSTDANETTLDTPTSVDAPGTQDARPIKGRKMLFNAVEISPSSATKRKYMNTPTDDKPLELKKSEEKMKHLKNPKVKNDRTPKLSADIVQDRLQQIGLDLFPIALSKSLTDVTFQRDMISQHYGGNIRVTFPKIRRDMVAVHGLNDFMFINLQYNPHAPEVPGAPGLWYTVGQDRSIARAHPWAKEQRVMSRLVVGVWQYQGQYALIPADSLTKEEWGAQDVKLRNKWAQEIHERVWGRPTRARIALRARLGRLPTRAELAAALQGDSKFHEVTSAQIAGALLKGEETMAVWAMKCVGYDENFQKELIEKQKSWVAPTNKAKDGAGKRTKSKKTPSKAGSSRKRKAEALASESSSDEDISDSSNDELQVISKIKSLAGQRRTRHTT